VTDVARRRMNLLQLYEKDGQMRREGANSLFQKWTEVRKGKKKVIGKPDNLSDVLFDR